MKPVFKFTLTLIVLLGLFPSSQSMARDSRHDVNIEKSRPMIRGGIVFKTYCKLCHGHRGDGIARASKLYGGTSLAISDNSSDYFRKIIMEGGEAVGKSPLMPVWKDELSAEQIDDVVTYLSVLKDPLRRGEVVFKTNCILCHGVKGDGKGRASVLYDPPPANLIESDKNEDYMRSIITFGGKAMGRSEVMPVWGEQISKKEIEDVLYYVRNGIMRK